ncbi:ataxin-7-like protein 3 isoform X2 [Babylonia areolata]|uniref:ataxin-7-like protein 3 isoform X2 n=1 Tax=Babylonia areolata TaxID=304850 RepID=UPI003FD1730B
MDSEELQSVLVSVMEELIEDQCLGLCFEVHRACRTGAFLIADTDPESAENFALINKPGVDVLGQTPTKKSSECMCPNCFRNLAAARFAPHLEKCMGMGRNSSRIASRRIANNTKRDSDDSGGGDDDNNDNDWSYGTENKKVKKLKKEKGANSPRNRKAGRVKNGVPAGSSHASSNGPHSSQESVESVSETAVVPNYENMTIEDRKALLLNTCGVISEHTGKMCTRSVRCPQHTDEQRRQVRHLLLRQSRQQPQTTEREDALIDIDTCDDTETQSLRESLQWEASSNSSPADSTSTNNNRNEKADRVSCLKAAKC